jgi:hypothetical protein
MTLSTMRNVAAALIMIAALSGCSRYQIQGDGQGRIVRLDRLTGQVDYLQGTRFVRVENPGDRRREMKELGQVKDWGVQQYDQKYTLRMKTAWRNDRMYYQIGIVPTPPAAVFNFRIALNDTDGFQLASISLNVPDGTATTDGGILYSGFSPVDEDVYRSVASWSPRVEFYSGRVPTTIEELP